MKHRTIVYLALYLAVFMLFLAGCFHRARPVPVQPAVPQCLAIDRGFAVEYSGECPRNPDPEN